MNNAHTLEVVEVPGVLQETSLWKFPHFRSVGRTRRTEPEPAVRMKIQEKLTKSTKIQKKIQNSTSFSSSWHLLTREETRAFFTASSLASSFSLQSFAFFLWKDQNKDFTTGKKGKGPLFE